jgi:hypothetical protein
VPELTWCASGARFAHLARLARDISGRVRHDRLSLGLPDWARGRPTRQARMDEWLAGLLDEPWARSHDAVPGPNGLVRVAIVPGTGWGSSSTTAPVRSS